MRAIWLIPATLSLALILSGCDSANVASDLNQRDANEIVSVLNGSGIQGHAEKERGARGKYVVEVPRGFYSDAVQLLHKRGLPPQTKIGFEELIGGTGILPSSKEVEAIRLDHAMASEIEELLSAHPAVDSVSVVARVRSAESSTPPSMAVMVQRRSGMPLDTAEITRLVSGALPGLKPENVAVVVHEIPLPVTSQSSEGVSYHDGQVRRFVLVPFLGRWLVPEEHYDGIALTVVSILFVAGLITACFGYFIGRFIKSGRDRQPTFQPELTPLRSIRTDREREEDGGMVG